MASDNPKIDDIYLAAMEKTEGEERGAYLDQVCGSDSPLRVRVERLLSVQPIVGSFLESPAPGINVSPTIDQPITEKPGTQIGPYKLLQKVGEGGMGAVYMAEQKEPVRRRVALKIIKPGMDTGEVVARFEAERQALAMMDHPNIAKVLDCGTTQTGRPFFVMELVKGVSITKYCDANHLTPKERLELFVPVCQAIQHAHQKGIIHRDIKPSNILIAEYDHKAVPKIIDFGVAKALDQQLTDKTMFTQLGQIIGTIEYMSPEQAKVNQLDVDTRSDIYSLGVLLYELLSGSTPFDRKRLRSVAIDELMRILREEDPPRPSTRLSTVETLPSIAANRKTEPKKLSMMLHGELDWIVMKAMEKDRGRRYDSASAFADDIQNYLNDDAVLACPPSAGYRFRKLARRNKVAFATGAVIALSILTTAVVSVWMAVLAINARSDADRRFLAEKEARGQAIAQKQVAQTKEREAQEALYESAFAQAQTSRWSRRPGQRWKSLEALSKAAELRRSLGLDPSEILKMRNEAIASMGLIDLKRREGPSFELPRSDWNVTFDPQHKYYACLTSEGNISVREFAGHREIKLLKIGVNAIRQFSPDGRYLAGHYPTGVCWIWDRSRDEVTYIRETVSGNPGLIKTFSFSGNGQYLAIALRNGSVGLFDPSGRRKIDVIPVAASRHELNFEGDKLAVRRSDKTDVVEIWDIPSRAMVKELSHPASVESMAWCPNGKWLACAADLRYTIHLWDCESWEEHAVLRGHKNGGLKLRFSHDGRILSSCGWDVVTRLWDPVDGQQLVNAALRHEAFSADDGQLIFLDASTKVGIWDVVTKPDTRRTLISIDKPQVVFRSANFSSDGRILAIAANSANGGIYFFEVYSGRLLASIDKVEATSVYFHPSLDSFLSFGFDGLLRWPISARANNTVLQIGPPERVSSSEYDRQIKINLDQSADGNRLVAADGRHSMSVLNMENVDRQLSIKRNNIDFVTISPDGNWVAAGNRFGEGVKVYDAKTGLFVKDLWPGSLSKSVFFDRSGKLIAAGCVYGYRFFEVGSWRPIPELTNAATAAFAVAFSNDGRMVAVTKGKQEVLLLDLDSGAEIAAIGSPFDRGNLQSIRFSPDDSHLVLLFRNSVELWDLRTVRTGLAEMGLDWDLPPLPEPGKNWGVEPIEIDLNLGLLAGAEQRRRTLEHVRARRWPEAIEEANLALELYSEDAVALRLRARAHIALKQYQQAIDDDEQALQYAQRDASTDNNLAWQMVLATDLEPEFAAKAVEWAESADRLRPDDPNTLNTLGVAYYRAKRWDDATETLVRSDDLHGGAQFAWNGFFLAMAQWQKDEKQLAMQRYRQSIEWMDKNEPNDDELKQFRAEAEELMQITLAERNEVLIEGLNEAIRLDPDNAKLYRARGKLFKETKQWQLALDNCSELIRLEPENVDRYWERTSVYFQQHNWEAVIEDCTTMIKLNPQSRHYVRRGWVHASKNDFDLAISDYNEAIRINPEHWSAYAFRGWAHWYKQQLELALKDANHVLEKRPGDANYLLGYIHVAQDDHQTATRTGRAIGCPDGVAESGKESRKMK